MNDNQQSNWSVFKVGGLVLIVTMLWFAIFGENGYVDLFKRNHSKKELEARVAEIERQNQALRDEIEALTDEDNKEVERIARKDLGMVKDGEVVYQFRDDKNKEKVDIKEDEEGQQQKR